MSVEKLKLIEGKLIDSCFPTESSEGKGGAYRAAAAGAGFREVRGGQGCSSCR